MNDSKISEMSRSLIFINLKQVQEKPMQISNNAGEFEVLLPPDGHKMMRINVHVHRLWTRWDSLDAEKTDPNSTAVWFDLGTSPQTEISLISSFTGTEKSVSPTLSTHWPELLYPSFLLFILFSQILVLRIVASYGSILAGWWSLHLSIFQGGPDFAVDNHPFPPARTSFIVAIPMIA